MKKNYALFVMDKQMIKLDFNKAFYFAKKGILRAALFSGIVLNNVNSFNIKSWHIKDNFLLIPDKVDESEVLFEFKNFVAKNALREMMELFDITLIHVFQILNITDKHINKIDFKDYKKETKKFKKEKFPNKLKIIDNLLNNELSQQTEFWQPLQDIRNCITHNVSIVDKEEININIPNFIMIFKGIHSGQEFVFSGMSTVEKSQVPEESELFIKIENITKTFKKGEMITFTNEETTLLIFGMIKSLAIFEKIVLANALNNEIPVIDKSINKSFKMIQELYDFKDSQNNPSQSI